MALLPEDMGCAGTDPAGDMLYREFLKEEKKKKEQEFQKQFREMIQSLSAALNTGYSVENAFYETQKELKILYPPEARISKELLVITRKLRIHIRLNGAGGICRTGSVGGCKEFCNRIRNGKEKRWGHDRYYP